MAGASSRFINAGYTQKKFMLELFGRPLFDAVLNGFARHFHTSSFVFVTQSTTDDVKEFVLARCQLLGLPADRIKVINLTTQTSGQAESVAIGLAKAKVALNSAIAIFNIDTIRHAFDFPEIIGSAPTAGYLEVFKGAGENWSFVEMGDEGLVRRVTEKQRISDLCSTGLYHFSEAGNFLDAFQSTAQIAAENLQGGERYVAPLYNNLIAKGLPVRFHCIAREELVFCGIPQEYEDALERWDIETFNKFTGLG